MKRPILILSFLFTLSSVLWACRDAERDGQEVEIMEERDTEFYEEDGAMDGGFGAYDANMDNQWDENEFSEAYQADFSGYDAQTWEDLNNDNFYEATFRDVDRNWDSIVDRDEWDAGYDDNFGEYVDRGDFDRFDTDQSGDLSTEEWTQGFSQSDWFTSYDTDQNRAISSEEWTRANFSRWDRNGDGVLDQQEFQAYNRARQNMESGNKNP